MVKPILETGKTMAMNLLASLRWIFVTAVCFSSLLAVADSEGYSLGAGDVIRINVYGEPDLSFDAMLVGESGKISYPFLGEIIVKGVTLSQLEDKLLSGLQPDFLIDPKISVSIVEYRPFYISGEVTTPGSYPYKPGLKLRQAVSMAKGFTERASQTKIYVVHDTDPNAKRNKADLNYNVRPGDTITVEESFF
ncbi:MAG: polysaccharide export protein [Porticoccaceae bacterium]|nr:polysaccharide export protein [Porticoccaceae bacterium]